MGISMPRVVLCRVLKWNPPGRPPRRHEPLRYGPLFVQRYLKPGGCLIISRHSGCGQDFGLTLSETYSELLMAKRKPKRRRRTVLRDSPNPVDVHVGKRIRERRVSLGMSQANLGDYLGLTFQQIQKYERGANRISASKLWALSDYLKVSVEWFFDGLGKAGKGKKDVMTRPETHQLARYYSVCPASTRKRLLALIRETAGVRGKGGRRRGRGQ